MENSEASEENADAPSDYRTVELERQIDRRVGLWLRRTFLKFRLTDFRSFAILLCDMNELVDLRVDDAKKGKKAKPDGSSG